MKKIVAREFLILIGVVILFFLLFFILSYVHRHTRFENEDNIVAIEKQLDDIYSKKLLWYSLVQKKVYTESYDNFNKEFSTAEKRKVLYHLAINIKLWDRDFADYEFKFFRKESAQAYVYSLLHNNNVFYGTFNQFIDSLKTNDALFDSAYSSFVRDGYSHSYSDFQKLLDVNNRADSKVSIAESELAEQFSIKNNLEQELNQKIDSQHNQSDNDLLGNLALVLIAIFFLARYLFYLVRWSLRELKRNNINKTSAIPPTKSEPLDMQQLTYDHPQKREMNEKEKINELIKGIGLVGSKTYSDFITCTNGNKSKFKDLTKLEAEISAFMKYDYLIAGQQVSLNFRGEFHRVSIEYLYHKYKDRVLNNNLSDLIENRYAKYGEILVTAGDKWQQNLIEAIIGNLQDSKNKTKMEEVYPLDLSNGFTDDLEFKRKFIPLGIESLIAVKKIIENIFLGNNLREIIPSNNSDSTDFSKTEERQMKQTTIDQSKVSASTKERGRKILEDMKKKGLLLDKVGQSFVITKPVGPPKKQ